MIKFAAVAAAVACLTACATASSLVSATCRIPTVGRTAGPYDAATVAPAKVADFVETGIGARGGGQEAWSAPAHTLAQAMKVGSYFVGWYALNVVYNISNKEILNSLPLPWTTAVAQLGIGLLFVFPAWLSGLRKSPKISVDDAKAILPISVMHAVGHMVTVVALGSSTVGFTHIVVKASEPFFSTATSAVFLKTIFRWQVYAALVPIVCGVALASVTELSFSWLSFLLAIGSNTAFALRTSFSKRAMNTPRGEDMAPQNLYSVITGMSFLLSLPLAVLFEGPNMVAAFDKAITTMDGPKPFLVKFMTAGLSYYLYNELAFLALNSVHPITHAVGNAIKRVVIVLASAAYFRKPMRPMAAVGSSMAILGTLLYSLAKSYTPSKEE